MVALVDCDMRFMMTSSYGYWGDISPDDLYQGSKKQVGGGETAMFSIARELAKRGHDVFVFYDTPKGKLYEGVQYLPTRLYQELIVRMPCDVLVSWDNMMAFRYADLARVHAYAFQLNDCYPSVFIHDIDVYLHPSKWHMRRMHDLYRLPSDRQFAEVTNGIDIRRYQQPVERDLYRVVYSSSPDRGLHHLLRIWPEVVRRQPKANLHIYYDMSKWLNVAKTARQQGLKIITDERAELVESLLENCPNTQVWGGIGQWDLARAQLAARVVAYPCDPVAPTEGFSMTCLEALCAGTTLVVTSVDALGELWRDGPSVLMFDTIDDATWIDAIVSQLGTPAPPVSVQPYHLWEAVALRWEQVFNGR